MSSSGDFSAASTTNAPPVNSDGETRRREAPVLRRPTLTLGSQGTRRAEPLLSSLGGIAVGKKSGRTARSPEVVVGSGSHLVSRGYTSDRANAARWSE
jgi:hypothetical protein